MSADYLLDTGVANLIALDNPAILQRVTATRRVQVPDIVFGELYFGAYFYAYKYNNVKLLDRYDDFRQRYGSQLLQSDLDTAQTYGAIADKASRTRPDNPTKRHVDCRARPPAWPHPRHPGLRFHPRLRPSGRDLVMAATDPPPAESTPLEYCDPVRRNKSLRGQV